MRRKDREITDEKIIADILKRADVCRLAFVDGNLPYIVAMNFGLEFGSESGRPEKLYFHCAPTGRKIGLIGKNPCACFQMDIDHNLREAEVACDWSMNYKSIVGYGRVQFIPEPALKEKALNSIMNHYNTASEKGYYFSEKDLKTTTLFELTIESLTAKMREL